MDDNSQVEGQSVEPDPTQAPDAGMPNMTKTVASGVEPSIGKCPTCGRDKPNQE